jgi:hypothetical protein
MKPAFNFKAMEHRARGMSVEALRWSILDCKASIKAFPESENAGYYMDEVHTYAMELTRREKRASR